MVDARPSESDLLGFSVPLEIFLFVCLSELSVP